MVNKKIMIVGVLTISFIISLFFLISNDNKYTRVSFYFFDELKGDLVLEDRYVLNNRTDYNTMIIDELFLGPMSVFNRKLVPFDFKYRSFYVKDKIGYLDLPRTFITEFNDKDHSIEDVIKLIKMNLIRNIRHLKGVVLTVDGQLMGQGPAISELPQ